jgi:hypothetical protein
MRSARIGAGTAGGRATPAMGVLVLVAFVGAGAAQMRAQRAEIAMVIGSSRESADGRFADGSAIQVQQRASLQQAIA